MKYRIFYFYPPFEGETMSIIVPEDQVEYNDGHFTKTIRRYEAKNWDVKEIKQKEKPSEDSQIHPLTGQVV
jgi:phage pi2 protein 07